MSEVKQHMADDKNNAVAVRERELPEPVTRRGISEAQWLTLCNSLYPGANPKSVLLVIDYCVARGLDPMKKPCHIVPMEIKVNGQYEWRDVVMPGIYEYRITAHRTHEYLGHAEPVYGPEKEIFGVTAPEWCEFTVYRWNVKANMKVPYPVRTMFAEVVATKRDRETKELRANGRWTRAPIQMLTKCAEASALREAFPEELGGEPTAEEMEGHTINVSPVPPAVPSAWERVPEALRDTLERAFAALKLSEAQRLVKLNEYLTVGADPTEAIERLLAQCAKDFTRTADPVGGKESNRKKATAPIGSTGSAPPVATVPAPVEAGDSNVRTTGTEAPSRGSGPVAPVPSPTTGTPQMTDLF